MRGTVGAWGVGVVAAAVLLGCGPGKQLPDKVAPPSQRSGPEPDAPPATSEEAAKKIVAKCLDATTEKNPLRIEKAKASKSTAKGVMQRPLLEQIATVETTRRVQAVWPDRTKWVYDFKSDVIKPLSVGLRRPAVWVRDGNDPVPLPDTRAAEDVVLIDTTGQYWMLMLVPLTDPKAVVFAAGTAPIGPRTADTFKLALPGLPVFHLAVDQQTGLLARVEYANTEDGVVIRKILSLSDYKPTAGVQLPTKIEFVRNNNLVEKWSVESWEFVDAIDNAVFDPPK